MAIKDKTKATASGKGKDKAVKPAAEKMIMPPAGETSGGESGFAASETSGGESYASENDAPFPVAEAGLESQAAAGEEPEKAEAAEPAVVELILLKFVKYLPIGSVIKVPADEAQRYIDSGKARRRE